MRAAPTLLLTVAGALTDPAVAHGLAERYDLPVPMGWVVVGACCAVALSFAAAALFAQRASPRTARRFGVEVALPLAMQSGLRGMAWLLFVLTIAAALWGTQDPSMNLAPTLVWIVWWVGMSFVSALVGGLWCVLDPWRTSFEMLNAAARRLGRPAGLTLGWRYPAWLGQWPAVALLLLWCWLEVVYPLASSPFKLGSAALLWTVINLGGMAAFGRTDWQAHADAFALVFATLGRMAPLRLRTGDAHLACAAAGQSAFVMAMLASVVFDGLHGSAAWLVFEGALQRTVPRRLDVNGLVAGGAGLLAVWLAFLLLYRATLHISLKWMRSPAPDAGRLAFTLVPIALAYNLAHNLSNLLIQGQTVFQLLSDPFGRQWDLMGTARWYPQIGIVDARLIWFVAVAAIVAGHMLSVWWSHTVVLQAGVPARRAALAMLPLTLLMLAYTAVSLTLIAAPMVASP